MLNKVIRKEADFAGKKLILETGELAKQAHMSVKAVYGDTVVLATVVSADPNPDLDYFPLSVNYFEKLYASGTIKSSRFVKRDGRPTDESIIIRRLIDHAVRPLFPQDEGFMDEVQLTLNVLSLDDEADPVFLSMVAASACLHASKIPWKGPMTSARVGYINGDYVLNPSLEKIEAESELDLVVSFVGKDKRFLAMEAEAHILPEEVVLGAINFANKSVDPILSLINDFAEEVNPGIKKNEFASKLPSDEVMEDVKKTIKDKTVEVIEANLDTIARVAKWREFQDELYTTFEGVYKKTDLEKAFQKVQKDALEHLVLEKGKRPDGRAIDEIRDLSGSVGVLPRVHGSSIFTRGQTQILNVATLGSPSMEQLIQDMYGERSKKYIHYYNFPPFSTGETGRMSGPGGREIGHGMLAEKALKPVIPAQKDFPYTIILTSETLESNGSSSMASTCASSLTLMDSGVPIKTHVAGIGVGLIVNKDFSKYALLTDIAGLEDGSGYMDFKMTGTREGVTAIQVDIKAKGLGMEMLPEIFKRSHDARMKVLDVMEAIIAEPRAKVSQYAPKTVTTKVAEDQIGMIIGSGGKTIKQIQEDTGTVISIEQDGTVAISSESEENVNKAKEIIENMIRVVEVGEMFDGVVEELAPYGAFVEVLPGKTGLLHVSEISNEYVENVESVLKVGQQVKVKVIEAGRDGKFSLSIKAAMDPNYVPKPKPESRGGGRGGNGRGGNGGGRGGFNRR